MIRSVTLILALGFALPAAADTCTLPPAPGAKDPAARIGKSAITVAEVDARIATELCQARMELAKKQAEMRQQALGQLIAEKVLLAEAEKRKLAGVEALIEAEVVTPVKAPGQAELRAFYDENAQQMSGASFEDMAPRIAQHLVQQQQQARFDALVNRLRAEAGVVVTLEPFRMAVGGDGPAKGPADAAVTIVSFADYECPYCSRGASILEEVRAKYPKQVRLVFRDFPLDFHPNAVPAAIAARCAGAQGKYYAMHDKLFGAQRSLDPATFKAHATALGLDIAKFDACFADPSHLAAIAADQKAGRALGVEGTPAFFVNGIPLSGAQPIEAFLALVEGELARKK